VVGDGGEYGGGRRGGDVRGRGLLDDVQQGLGRTGEVFFLSDGDEGLEMTQFHDSSP
jgi:hypothetical protein